MVAESKPIFTFYTATGNNSDLFIENLFLIGKVYIQDQSL